MGQLRAFGARRTGRTSSAVDLAEVKALLARQFVRATMFAAAWRY